jgi:hypothetical protein
MRSYLSDRAKLKRNAADGLFTRLSSMKSPRRESTRVRGKRVAEYSKGGVEKRFRCFRVLRKASARQGPQGFANRRWTACHSHRSEWFVGWRVLSKKSMAFSAARSYQALRYKGWGFMLAVFHEDKNLSWPFFNCMKNSRRARERNKKKAWSVGEGAEGIGQRAESIEHREEDRESQVARRKRAGEKT